MQVHCAQCSKPFEAQRVTARYCSGTCRVHARWARLGGRPQAPPREAALPDLECPQCGCLFNGRRRKFCSAACQKAAALIRDAARYWERRSADDHLLDKVCIICVKPFRAKRVDARLCGEYECTYEYMKVRNGVRQCEHCGEGFRASSPRTRYCSPECVKASNCRGALEDYASESERNTMKGQRRRARKNDAYVEEVVPSVVFERDGWICQLCHEPVDKTLHGWNRMAASVDHIIPLFQGGLHCYSNVQLAHKSCNSSKGARWQGQLVLI